MYEIRSRRKAQPAPDWAVWEALSDPVADQRRREWLVLATDEVTPRIVEARRPDLVVWTSLWPSARELRVRFDIDGDGGAGCWLTWTLLSPVGSEDQQARGKAYRLNQLINAELRFSFGQ